MTRTSNIEQTPGCHEILSIDWEDAGLYRSNQFEQATTLLGIEAGIAWPLMHVIAARTNEGTHVCVRLRLGTPENKSPSPSVALPIPWQAANSFGHHGDAVPLRVKFVFLVGVNPTPEDLLHFHKNIVPSE